MTAIRPPSGDQAICSTSMPLAVSAVACGGRGSRCGRPRRGTGASISQTCDQPRRRDRNASRRPSGDHCGSRPPPGLATTFVSRDPSASTIQISSSRTKARRRPSGDHCGSPIAFSDAVICVAGAPVPRSDSVKSWRAPAISAVYATVRSRGLIRNSRGDSTATIPSMVRPAAPVAAPGLRSVGIRLRGQSATAHQRPEHREVLADVAVQAVLGPAPAVRRAEVLDREGLDGGRAGRRAPTS